MLAVSPARAAWSLLLMSFVASGAVGKEACPPSDLQTSSSVHEAGQPSQANMLLQVGARTGEVSQYLPSHEEDAAHQHSSQKRHREIVIRDSTAGAGSEETPVSAAEVRGSVHDPHYHHDDENSASKSEGKSADDENSASKSEDKSADEKTDKTETKVLEGARIAPFGKEDTGRELQHHAARTQDTLVDAIENAEVAEIKRSIFRSLTRLRAAEIKEFDTIARLETQAIDEYNDNHHYRAENPLDYIHGSEVAVKEDKYTSFHD